MKSLLRGFLGLGVMLVSVAGQAATTEQLHDACLAALRVESAYESSDYSHLSAKDHRDSQYCIGFLEGWASMMPFSLRPDLDHPPNYVSYEFADDSTTLRSIRVFVEYVDNHGNSLKEGPQDVLVKALKEKGIIKIELTYDPTKPKSTNKPSK